MSDRMIVSRIGSERATVGDGNKIVTAEGKTHVVWQDISRGGYLNQVRTVDRLTGNWSDPITLGYGLDNHARPILTVDHEGFLHVVLGGHNSPVTWRRSKRPNDSSEWSDPEPVGEGTYPVLVCGSDCTLFLTLRANQHAGVDFYAKPIGRPWELRSRIVRNAEEYREAYGAFHMQMMMGPDGVLHAAIDFFEGQDEAGRGLHQAVCYVRSTDGGLSWMKADGSPVKTPGRPEDMDILARSVASRVEALPRVEDSNGGLWVDSKGVPHILHLSHREAPGQLHLVSMDGGRTPVRKKLDPFLEREWPEMRVNEARGTIMDDDTIHILVTLSPYNHEWIQGRPSRAMNMVERDDQRLVLLTTNDFGRGCIQKTVVEPGNSFNAPNLETPVGANRLKAGLLPRFVYFDGTRGYPGGGDYYDKPVGEYLEAGEFSENRVWMMGDESAEVRGAAAAKVMADRQGQRGSV